MSVAGDTPPTDPGVPFRVHRGGYVTLPNSTVNDRRLSLRDLGLLVYMTGRPPGWRFSADAIARAVVEGRDAVATSLRSLRDAGYYRTSKRQGPDGRWVSCSEVAVDPILMPDLPPDQLPEPTGHGFPGVGYPGPGQPGVGGPGPKYVKPGSQKDNPQSSLREDSPQVDDVEQPAVKLPAGFATWWAVYPRKERKQAAVRAWPRARKLATIAQLVDGAEQYRDDPNRLDEFTAHPATWLNQGGWDDAPLPPRQGPPGTDLVRPGGPGPAGGPGGLDATTRSRLARAAQLRQQGPR